MASAVWGTLVAGAVTSVTVDTFGDDVIVNNLDPSPDWSQIVVSVDGTATPADPVVAGGDKMYAVSGMRVFANNTSQRRLTLKLISSVAIPFSVEAVAVR